jgi:hypothetical protein
LLMSFFIGDHYRRGFFLTPGALFVTPIIVSSCCTCRSAESC